MMSSSYYTVILKDEINKVLLNVCSHYKLYVHILFQEKLY